MLASRTQSGIGGAWKLTHDATGRLRNLISDCKNGSEILSDTVAPDRARGSRFSAERMAANYLFRPPYPAAVYDTLLELLRGHPRILLDAGCGTGKITLGLIDQIDRADGVDPSDAMLRVACALPGAASAKIRWIHASIEDALLEPPYGLIVAAS